MLNVPGYGIKTQLKLGWTSSALQVIYPEAVQR